MVLVFVITIIYVYIAIVTEMIDIIIGTFRKYNVTEIALVVFVLIPAIGSEQSAIVTSMVAVVIITVANFCIANITVMITYIFHGTACGCSATNIAGVITVHIATFANHQIAFIAEMVHVGVVAGVVTIAGRNG
jgi:hypothetical protein